MLIPEAVRATVLRRMRSMNPAEREVLMRASAIGRRFDLDVLIAAAACCEVRVHAALDDACSLQLLVADDPGGTRYSFRHALTRDIVYAELLSTQIRPLHRRIARALERSSAAGETSLGDLAYHWWAAGDPGPCLLYNERAGDNAAEVHALDDARTYYGRAQSLVAPGSAAYARLAKKLSEIGAGEPIHIG